MKTYVSFIFSPNLFHVDQSYEANKTFSMHRLQAYILVCMEKGEKFWNHFQPFKLYHPVCKLKTMRQKC